MSNVKYEDFLLEIESPQFKKNAKEIFEYLSQTADSSWLMSRLLGSSRRVLLVIQAIKTDLLFLSELKSTRDLSGKTFHLRGSELIDVLIAGAEDDYLGKLHYLSSLWSPEDSTSEMRQRVKESREQAENAWLSDENADILTLAEYREYLFNKNQLKLDVRDRVTEFSVAWRERVLMILPFHDAIWLLGRPIPFESLQKQLELVNYSIANAEKVINSAQDYLVEDFIESLLLSRVRLDNKLYRDVYRSLVLFGRLPEDLIKSHDSNEEKNKSVRETFIRQRFYRTIDKSSELMLWYDRMSKPLKNRQ